MKKLILLLSVTLAGFNLALGEPTTQQKKTCLLLDLTYRKIFSFGDSLEKVNEFICWQISGGGIS